MSKIIKFEQEARQKIKNGIDLAVNLIKPTMGPYGRNVILGKLDIPPYITNDGVSIARNVESDDETENLGVWLVKEALSWASKKGGDSTTATAVFLQAIVEGAFKMLEDDGSLVSKKIDVMSLKRQIDEACEKIVTELKKESREMKEDEMYNVALTSGEYPWIAEIVTNIFKKIGKNGYVKIEEGNKTSYEVYSGIELPVGYHSDYFVNDENGQCKLKDVSVFVTNNRLDTPMVVPIIAELANKEMMNVILIAPDFTRDLLSRLITTKTKTGFTAIALKLPTFDKDDLLIDIATLTNAKFFDKNVYPDADKFIKDIKVENLGKIREATISDSKSILVGGEGDVKERIDNLHRMIEATTSTFDKDNLEKRIASLSGGFASIKVGSETDFEREYFKLKAENSINSVQNAMKFGVIKGGGITLKKIAETLPKNILTDVLTAPYRQIQENAGQPFEIPESVLDSTHSISTALKVACSLAGTAITMSGSVAFKKDEHKD